MSLGYNALPSSGPITISDLNDYFGCSSTTTRSISGIGSAPNFSVNQIFNSNYNSTTPASNNMQLISLRYYKTFGIFTSTSRNSLVSNLTTVPGPVWYGYFGFGGTSTGTSGILNPSNRGFPMSIRIRVISGSRFDLYVEYIEDQTTFQWRSQALTSNDTSLLAHSQFDKGYHLLVINSSNAIKIRQPTVADKVPDYTSGDTIIAIIEVSSTTSDGSRKIQS